MPINVSTDNANRSRRNRQLSNSIVNSVLNNSMHRSKIDVKPVAAMLAGRTILAINAITTIFACRSFLAVDTVAAILALRSILTGRDRRDARFEFLSLIPPGACHRRNHIFQMPDLFQQRFIGQSDLLADKQSYRAQELRLFMRLHR